MNKYVIMAVYFILITCGVIAILGAPSPTLERQGGTTFTVIWSSLCVIAGCVGVFGTWRRSRAWEILAAFVGAAATGTWVASLILQGVKTGTLNTASAACMGIALTALLTHQGRRLGGDTS